MFGWSMSRARSISFFRASIFWTLDFKTDFTALTAPVARLVARVTTLKAPSPSLAFASNSKRSSIFCSYLNAVRHSFGRTENDFAFLLQGAQKQIQKQTRNKTMKSRYNSTQFWKRCPSCMSRMNRCRRSLWPLGVLPPLEEVGDLTDGVAKAEAGEGDGR